MLRNCFAAAPAYDDGEKLINCNGITVYFSCFIIVKTIIANGKKLFTFFFVFLRW